MSTTIKERLRQRILASREIVGKKWRVEVERINPFFLTKKGQNYLNRVSWLCTNPDTSIDLDALEMCANALDEAAGVESNQLI